MDIYLPTNSDHPTLRIRKRGNQYEITKKEPLENDPSRQKEETTSLTPEEFNELNQSVRGKRLHKIRYYYPVGKNIAEIDVFQGDLRGLVLVDVEFEKREEKHAFIPPALCFLDVTDKEFVAGGKLCGKKYEEIEEELKKVGYSKIS